MEARSYDRWRHALDEAIGRRGLTRLAAGALTSLAWLLAADHDAAAKKKKKKGKGKKGKGKKNKKKNRGNNSFGADPSLDGEESAFLTLINNHRASNGLGALAAHPQLGAAADYHSQDMAANNYFNHVSPGGIDPEQNVQNHGYSGYHAVGENIYAGSESAAAAFDAWRNSSGHNANMLASDFNEFSIGRAFNASSVYGWYWTTTFGGR